MMEPLSLLESLGHFGIRSLWSKALCRWPAFATPSAEVFNVRFGAKSIRLHRFGIREVWPTDLLSVFVDQHERNDRGTVQKWMHYNAFQSFSISKIIQFGEVALQHHFGYSMVDELRINVIHDLVGLRLDAWGRDDRCVAIPAIAPKLQIPKAKPQSGFIISNPSGGHYNP